MITYSDQSFIEKLPLNFFGVDAFYLAEQLSKHKSFSVNGIPGFGASELIKQLTILIQRRWPQTKVFNVKFFSNDNDFETINELLSKIEKSIGSINKNQLIKQTTILIDSSDCPISNKILILLNDFYERNKAFLSIANIGKEVAIEPIKNSQLMNNKLFKHKNVATGISFTNVQKYLSLLADTRNITLSPTMTKKLFFLSGGNFQLLKTLSLLCYEQGEAILDRSGYLIHRGEIEIILRAMLSFVVNKDITDLLNLGIITSNGSLFSNLLTEYLKIYEEQNFDILFPKLTKTDRKLLSIFISNPGKIVDKDQIVLVLEQTANTDAGWSIYKAVERFKKKIQHQYPIRMVKGQGWMLDCKSYIVNRKS